MRRGLAADNGRVHPAAAWRRPAVPGGGPAVPSGLTAVDVRERAAWVGTLLLSMGMNVRAVPGRLLRRALPDLALVINLFDACNSESCSLSSRIYVTLCPGYHARYRTFSATSFLRYTPHRCATAAVA